MRLEKFNDKDEWLLECATIPECCFLCGTQLQFPLVYWQGCGAQIWLHLDCARNLGEKLILDADAEGKG